jgi:tRNA pseudouridine32 synthase/23S rRNA pseudouridine746 synthase
VPDLPVLLATPRYAAIDKPAGLLSVPGRGADKQDCVASRVRSMFPDATGPVTVHRLDMETSGVLLVALDADAHRALSMQFERRTVAKRYIAVLDGAVEGDAGAITLRHRVDLDDRPRQILDDVHGKEAVTRWRAIDWSTTTEGVMRTRVEFEPITGRSHQLRIAAATPVERGGLGAPIAGDSLYGDGASTPRLLLHASLLAFDDPDSGERIEVRSDAPF